MSCFAACSRSLLFPSLFFCPLPQFLLVYCNLRKRVVDVHGPGFTFSFFYRIPSTPGNEILAEISPNFANSERKENSNSKNEISVNSDRNFGDFGDFDRKMMSVVIFVLFQRSNEKLLNTNFVQFFEIYNFCFRNFFI